MKDLPTAFTSILNNRLWPQIIEKYCEVVVKRPRTISSHEFYDRWRELYEFPIEAIQAIELEITNNDNLKAAISEHHLLSSGQRNYLRSPSSRCFCLSFALAIFYQNWKSGASVEKLTETYLEVRTPEERIASLEKQLEIEKNRVKFLTEQLGSASQSVTKLSAENSMLAARPIVIVKRTANDATDGARKRRKRSKKNIDPPAQD